MSQSGTIVEVADDHVVIEVYMYGRSYQGKIKNKDLCRDKDGSVFVRKGVLIDLEDDVMN